MESFQGGPGGMNSVLEAPNDFVVVGPRGVKGRCRWSLTSALWQELGTIEVLLYVVCFEGCWWYERCGCVGR